MACIRIADKSSTMFFAFCRQWVRCLVSAVPGTDTTGRTGHGCPSRAGLDGATPRQAQRPSRRSRLLSPPTPPPRRPPRLPPPPRLGATRPPPRGGTLFWAGRDAARRSGGGTSRVLGLGTACKGGTALAAGTASVTGILRGCWVH